MLKQKGFRLLTFGTLLLIALVFSPIMASASSGDSADDSTSVSSDGEEEKTVNYNEKLKNKDRVSESYKGSGKVTPFRDNSVDLNENLNYVKPSKIIGSDDRVRVTNTTDFSYSAVVHLSIEYPDDPDTYGCTGFLVNEDTVVTAGHCVHDSSKGGWAKNIDASPGRNGTSMPYNTYQNKTLYSVKGWTEKEKPEYDYGAIKLDGSPGNNTGWFGYRTTNGDDLDPVGKSATVSGYPGDKTIGTMWKDSDNINQALEYLLLYQIDTYDGQSGSSVYRNYSDTGQTAIAIHTGSLSSPYNRGTRITLDVFDNIDNWKDK